MAAGDVALTPVKAEKKPVKKAVKKSKRHRP
jgi:hypothetical protein